MGIKKQNMGSVNTDNRFFRIISKLDIKNENLIKGIHLEGLRVIGNPNQFAKKYYNSGIDEIFYHDAVASLYGRNSLEKVLNKTIEEVFVPITVGGGIRNENDAMKLFSNGADKISINSAAVKDPNIIKKLFKKLGAQSVVVSIEAKKLSEYEWEVYLAETASKISTIPLIYCGGFGTIDHIIKLVKNSNVDGIALASVLHYEKLEISEIKLSFTDLPFSIFVNFIFSIFPNTSKFIFEISLLKFKKSLFFATKSVSLFISITEISPFLS